MRPPGRASSLGPNPQAATPKANVTPPNMSPVSESSLSLTCFVVETTGL